MTPRRANALVAGLALLIAGCGDRNLVLSVDVLSFLSPDQTQTSFGPVPGVPGGAATGELPLVDDEQIQLFEGLGDASQVTTVTVSAKVQCADSTGSGTDTLRVYLSSANDPPRSQPPILETVLAMVPGRTDTVDAVIEGSQQLADLFTRQVVRLSITNSLRGPDVGETLNARIRLIELRAVVVAGRKSI
jgi:hypothetical protein